MGRPSRYPDEFRQANPLSVRPSAFEDLRRLRREDVDLMVIGQADVGEVRPEADVAARRLGRDVNATVLTPEERERGGTGFLTPLKAQPLVPPDLLR